mgnify:CR=1 FL=1
MINIENISISFGNLTLFRGLDLQVHYGESVCICGGSGSGKSSLLKAVLGFVPLSEGTIKVDGTLLAPRTADHIRKKIAWIPQELALPSEWVSEMVRMPFELKANREAGFNKERLMDYFVSLGLEEKLYDKRVNEVSGGQRQRIGIARALTVQPKLIIADEPVSALDVSIQAQVLNLLQQLQKDFNLTYLFISHDLSVVEMISDRIGVMYLGTIVETAPKKELYANPRHPYTRALLSAVPIPDPEVKKERITLKGDLPSPSNPPSGCLFHTRCPHCTEKCKTQVPTPVEIAPGHIVKCHYPELTE